MSAAVAVALTELITFLLREGAVLGPQGLESFTTGLFLSAAAFLILFLCAALVLLPVKLLSGKHTMALAALTAFFVTFLSLNLLQRPHLIPQSGSERMATVLFALFAALTAVGFWRSETSDGATAVPRPWLVGPLLAALGLGGISAAAWLLGLQAVAIVALVLLLGLIGSLLVSTELGKRLAMLCGPMLFLILCATFIFVRPPRSAETQSAGRETSASDGPRTVVLITIDTLRADTLEMYGGPPDLAPRLNALAEESAVFTNAVSAAPWTLPALSSIMTGLAPPTHTASTRYSTLPEDLRTLAEYLRADGYETLAVGTNPYLHRGLNQGFSEARFFPEQRWRSFGFRQAQKVWPSRWVEGKTGELTRLAQQMLEDHESEDLFLWVHYFDPHLPYEPPAKFQPSPDESSNVGQRFDNLLDIRRGVYVPSAADKARIRDLYHGEVAYVDRNVGQLLDSLKEMNRYSDALIVLTSDHGEEFWEHGGFEHGHSVFDELLRIPLLIKRPHSPASVITERVSTQSVLTTILDELEVEGTKPRSRAASRFNGFWIPRRSSKTNHSSVLPSSTTAIRWPSPGRGSSSSRRSTAPLRHSTI